MSASTDLSSLTNPQRRKSAEDELMMREFFSEGDLISVCAIALVDQPTSYEQAEVQSTFADGALSIQTRNLKYGKVR